MAQSEVKKETTYTLKSSWMRSISSYTILHQEVTVAWGNTTDPLYARRAPTRSVAVKAMRNNRCRIYLLPRRAALRRLHVP